MSDHGRSWRRWHILRFLQANKFDFHKTLHAVREHIKWRRQHLPVVIKPPSLEIIRQGIIYFHGRDHRYRPILILNPYRIDTKHMREEVLIEAIIYLLELGIERMMLPGQVENWVIIIDLSHMSFFSLPLGYINRFINLLQDNYRGRMYRMHIVNTPYSFYIPWRIVEQLLNETSRRKICITKDATSPKLLEHINREQLEQKYGGIAPNLTNFWPPTSPSHNYLLPSESKKELLISEEQYRKMYLEETLKENKISPFLDLWRGDEDEFDCRDMDENENVENCKSDDGSRRSVCNLIERLQFDLPKTFEYVERNNEKFYEFHEAPLSSRSEYADL